MKILIATTNKSKIEGAGRAFQHYFSNFEMWGEATESGVSEQPVDMEILQGAKNRVNNLKAYAKRTGKQADFFVAVESGITNALGKYMIVSVAVVEDKNGNESSGASSAFPVPEKYVEEIKATSLSHVMNKLFGKDEKRSTHGGAVENLTQGKVSRIDLNEQAVLMALTKFINGDVWR
ncbi:MAG: DUF84 family protein [Clostridia bacterium]|nr:DUF84 family protein [Clostridia bacterium]